MRANVIVKDLVLVGGGHTHVIVIKSFGMRPLPGVRVTLIGRDVETPYSGMLPGLVAGHYGFDDVHIDLAPLCRFADARLYHDEAIGLDTAARTVICRDRPPVRYDVLSIDIGSTPRLDDVPGARASVVPVKPISGFYPRWRALLEQVDTAERPLDIGVVGGGAGGTEILLAMQHGLGARRRAEARFHLFTASDEVLPTHNPRVRAAFTRILGERGVRVHAGARVTRVEAGALHLADGDVHRLDVVVWATEAGTQTWIRDAGLATDERGFAAVHPTLESTSHPGVFAAGDCAAVLAHPREKAGVFAVRQGPPLAANLRRALSGQPLATFTPQRRFLSLVSTGDRRAIASRGGTWMLEGAWVWRWKDWIDRRFMSAFSQLPEMAPKRASARAAQPRGTDAAAARETQEMRCGGCGAKVGATLLARVLGRLHVPRRADVLVGLDDPDDAAVVEVPPGKAVVQTVDAFRAMLDDPYLLGRIAANHGLSDIYAMGADPQSALAIATLPFGLESEVEDALHQMLSGAVRTLDDADTALVGGHTGEGAELALGFAINGLVDAAALARKSGMRAGDLLILTKAVGTGAVLAAHMRRRARGRWVTATVESMLQSNRDGAACLRRHEATACTDVSGFGLAGHLLEMTRASAVAVELDLGAVPCLDGAEETLALDIASSLEPENRRLERALVVPARLRGAPRYRLLFDPQTAGGLLASVPRERAEACVRELIRLGYARSAIVGRVLAPHDSERPITIVSDRAGHDDAAARGE